MVKTMTKFYLILFSFFLTIGHSYAQGERTFDVEDFSLLEVNGPFEVTLQHGSDAKVEMYGDDEVLDRITVKYQSGELIVRVNRGDYRWQNDRIDIIITYTGDIEALSIGGACKLEAEDEMGASSFELEVSGASTVQLRNLRSGDLDVEVSGASTTRLAGTADFQDVKISGASTYDARDLEGMEGEITASGASRGSINVTKSLEARATGASTIYYYGDPKYVDADSSGAGSVKSRS
jgi:hypothetical protein